MQEYWYSPTHANLSTEIKVDEQSHALASLTLRKSLGTLVEEAGWAPGPVWRFWRRENPLPTLGFEPCNIQPVPSCYTNYAILAPLQYKVWCSGDSPLYSHHFEFHQGRNKTYACSWKTRTATQNFMHVTPSVWDLKMYVTRNL